MSESKEKLAISLTIEGVVSPERLDNIIASLGHIGNAHIIVNPGPTETQSPESSQEKKESIYNPKYVTFIDTEDKENVPVLTFDNLRDMGQVFGFSDKMVTQTFNCFRRTRTCDPKVAPLYTDFILSEESEHVLGLPRPRSKGVTGLDIEKIDKSLQRRRQLDGELFEIDRIPNLGEGSIDFLEKAIALAKQPSDT